MVGRKGGRGNESNIKLRTLTFSMSSHLQFSSRRKGLNEHWEGTTGSRPESNCAQKVAAALPSFLVRRKKKPERFSSPSRVLQTSCTPLKVVAGKIKEKRKEIQKPAIIGERSRAEPKPPPSVHQAKAATGNSQALNIQQTL